MRTIELTQDQITLVDDEDYDRLNESRWRACWNQKMGSFYAQRDTRRNGKRTSLLLHREILGLEPGDPRDVHHVNGNTLDNRRSNLKVVTKLEHQDLHRSQPRKNVSQYGVGVYKRPSGFIAQVSIDSKQRYLGTYDTPEEAQQARADFLSQREALCA